MRNVDSSEDVNALVLLDLSRSCDTVNHTRGAKNRFSFIHVNDTRLAIEPSITSVAASISNMVHDVDAEHTWCSSKHIQLTPTKLEIIWFWMCASLRRLQNTDLCLHVSTVTIKPASVIGDLDVMLNSELAMWQRLKIHGTVLLSSSMPQECS